MLVTVRQDALKQLRKSDAGLRWRCTACGIDPEKSTIFVQSHAGTCLAALNCWLPISAKAEPYDAV